MFTIWFIVFAEHVSVWVMGPVDESWDRLPALPIPLILHHHIRLITNLP